MISFEADTFDRTYRGTLVTSRPFREALGKLREVFVAVVVERVSLDTTNTRLFDRKQNREINNRCIANI